MDEFEKDEFMLNEPEAEDSELKEEEEDEEEAAADTEEEML